MSASASRRIARRPAQSSGPQRRMLSVDSLVIVHARGDVALRGRSLGQVVAHRVVVDLGSILRELGLALDRDDVDLDADDGLAPDAPTYSLGASSTRHCGERPASNCSVTRRTWRWSHSGSSWTVTSTPDLGRDVVPGRYDSGALEATRVVRRRHVGARDEEESEHLVTVLQRSPPRDSPRATCVEYLRVDPSLTTTGTKTLCSPSGVCDDEHPGAGFAHDAATPPLRRPRALGERTSAHSSMRPRRRRPGAGLRYLRAYASAASSSRRGRRAE